MTEKQCTRCKRVKPLYDFHRNSREADGHRQACKVCTAARRSERGYSAVEKARIAEAKGRTEAAARVRALHPESYARTFRHAPGGGKLRHGITPAEKAEYLGTIGWACEGCRKPFLTPSDAKVDHDHAHCPGAESCGQCIRGLLCMGCNLAIGHAVDSPATLRALANYVERS